MANQPSQLVETSVKVPTTAKTRVQNTTHQNASTQNNATEVYVWDDRPYSPTWKAALHQDEVPIDISPVPIARLLDALREHGSGVKVRFDERARWTPISEPDVQANSETGTIPRHQQIDWEFPHWVAIEAPRGGHYRIAHGQIPGVTNVHQFQSDNPRPGEPETVVQRRPENAESDMYTMRGKSSYRPLIIHAGDANEAGLEWLRRVAIS